MLIMKTNNGYLRISKYSMSDIFLKKWLVDCLWENYIT